MNQNRKDFRGKVFNRDSHNCIIPWCDQDAKDAHHIIERSCWENGGYIPRNGASVCGDHHMYAEENEIPPQAFWFWLKDYDPILPDYIEDFNVNKWGEKFEKPPWSNLRERIKYQSTRHLLPLYWHDNKSLAENRMDNDDTGLETIEDFVGIPLVITQKIDGSNTMLVKDMENPVRARNGKKPEKTMKPLYKQGGLYWRQEVHNKLPDNLQVFGEWVYAKHSIHYGCDCEEECVDVGPNLSEITGVNDERAYFQVFGVYDKRLNIWLSWPETKKVAEKLGFPTTPEIYVEGDEDKPTFENKKKAIDTLIGYAREVIENGGEGIVVRTKYPFHYSDFERKLGKYVRENHVKTDEHWKNKEKKENNINDEIPNYFSI